MSGSLIIYQEEGTDKILLGKESIYIWENPDVNQKNSQRVEFFTHNLNDYNTREAITKMVVTQVQAQIKKDDLNLNEWLVPPVVKKTDQSGAEAGKTIYKTKARKQRADTAYGPPKGGSEGSETRLQTVIREIQEEIGNLDSAVLPLDADKYNENASNGYAIFYKKVTPAQARQIEAEIQRRYVLHIGEMFDLKFRDKSDGNFLTQDALKKIKAQDEAEKAVKAFKTAPKANVRLGASQQKTPGKPGSGWGKPKTAAAKGGRRKTKKQRKQKGAKKYTRRR
jgi:hypothetical protein